MNRAYIRLCSPETFGFRKKNIPFTNKVIFINNITIVTQNKKRQIIEDGAVLIKNDKIFDVGKTKDLEKKYSKKAKIINGENKVVMPGLINTHTHLAMTLLRGYADDLPLEKWWFEKIYPLESKFTAEDVYWGSLLGGIEMIKSGTTCFIDFYYFPDEIARAVKQIGIRANIGIGVLDVETFAFKNVKEILQQIPVIIKKYKADEHISISIAPHMLQTTSLETYKRCKKLAKQYKILLQTHLAETEQELKYSVKKYLNTPTETLIKNKILDKNSLVAHACWLAEKDIKLLAQSRVNISHCPISNMKLTSGIMPLTKLIKAGINISLGTDGACSNNALDMFSEMKTAALLHKINDKDPTVANAQTILDMATINGAKALGLEKQIGSIEIGKKADLIMLDFNQPHLTPCYNEISHLVYVARGGDVETIIIDGKTIMENKKIINLDEKSILQSARTTALWPWVKRIEGTRR